MSVVPNVLPAEFGVILLTVGFILTLAPYISGHDFGILKIPDFNKNTRSLLKWFGPLCLAGALLLHIPIGGNEITEESSKIYLTKIISSPGGEGYQKTSVFLSAVGKFTYIVDSIDISHEAGMLCSMGSGALPPDGKYIFPFEYDSTKTHVLDPSLVINPSDREEVSFTLELYPVGTFANVGGNVSVTLNYHTTNGEMTGRLFLRDSPQDGKFLSRLFNRDIEIYNNMIVTPSGIQRGRNSQENDKTRLRYNRLQMPWVSFYDLKIPNLIPTITLDNDRRLINSIAESEDLVPSLIEAIESGNEVAFDLCSGMLTEKCERAIVSIGLANRYVEQATKSLAIRHMLKPSNTLSEFLLNRQLNIELLGYSSGEDASIALFSKPKGEWSKALLRITSIEDTAWKVLWLRKDLLNASQVLEIESKCLAELNKPFPDEVAIKILLWNGHSVAFIKEKLQEITPATNNRNSRYYRNNLINELSVLKM